MGRIWLRYLSWCFRRYSGQQKRTQAVQPKSLFITGSPGRIRTIDRVVNSHLLCQLSYRGIFVASMYHKAIMPSIR